MYTQRRKIAIILLAQFESNCCFSLFSGQVPILKTSGHLKFFEHHSAICSIPQKRSAALNRKRNFVRVSSGFDSRDFSLSAAKGKPSFCFLFETFHQPRSFSTFEGELHAVCLAVSAFGRIKPSLPFQLDSNVEPRQMLIVYRELSRKMES